MRKESCDVEQLINITLGVTNKDKCRDVWSRPVFLNMCSAKGCQGFRETEVRNGGRVLLAVPYFYVRIKLRVATFHTDHFVAGSTQSINQSLLQSSSFLILQSCPSAQLAMESRRDRRNDEAGDQFGVK